MNFISETFINAPVFLKRQPQLNKFIKLISPEDFNGAFSFGNNIVFVRNKDLPVYGLNIHSFSIIKPLIVVFQLRNIETAA